MAIAFVNGTRSGYTASGANIPTTAHVLTAGNLHVVGFWVDDGAIVVSGVPTDTAGNTYLTAGIDQQMSGGAPNLSLFYCYNCLGHATNVVTLNLSGACTYRAWCRWQFSGVPASNPYISPFNFGTGASGQALSTASLSHGAAECVICAFGCSFNGFGGMLSGGSGYTFNKFEFDGGGSPSYFDEYHIVSADEAATALSQSTTDPWAILAASFGTQISAGVSRRGLALLGVGQ